MTVLVIRPEPDASVFAERLQRARVKTVVSPVIETHIDKKNIDLSGVGALAFTSSNGVRAFAANSAERSLSVFAVGEATAEAAGAAGFVSVKTAGGDVAALSTLIAQSREDFSGALLHIVGRDQAGDLVGALVRAGFEARKAVLYAAAPAPALTPGALAMLAAPARGDAVALFSPRSAGLFIALCKKHRCQTRARRLIALCLSAAVGEEARESGFEDIRIAKARHADAMVELASRLGD